MALTSPSSVNIMVVSWGAKMHEATVTIPSKVNAKVKRRRTKFSPLSASSFSARTRTGTTKEVRTAPRTISVMRLGSWFAVVNAEEIAGPSDEPMRTLRRKPVMREISVAIAMDPVARTTAPSEVAVSTCSPFNADLSSATGIGATLFSGTGAGGVGVTMRRREPFSLVIKGTNYLFRNFSFFSAPAGIAGPK